MNANFEVLTKEVQMIGFTTDARSEEEWGVGDIIRAKRDNRLHLNVIEYPFDGTVVPVLLFLPDDSKLTAKEVKKLNNGEIERKLDSAKRDFERFCERVLEGDNRSPLYLDRKDKEITEGLFSESRRLLASFYHGRELAFFPNPYMIALRLDETRQNKDPERSYERFIRGTRNKDELIAKLKERRVEIFDALKEKLNAMLERIGTEGYMISGGSGNPFANGTNLLVMPTEKREFFEKEGIFPYEMDEQNELLVEIPADRLALLVEERRIYLAEKEVVKKQLDAVKEELKKAGRNWFALDTLKKIEGVWRVWLNPMEQHRYNYGWFTLEDLLEWKNEKGQIMMQR